MQSSNASGSADIHMDELAVASSAAPRFYAIRDGICGTLGCTLPDFHLGECIPHRPSSNKRTRR